MRATCKMLMWATYVTWSSEPHIWAAQVSHMWPAQVSPLCELLKWAMYVQCSMEPHMWAVQLSQICELFNWTTYELLKWATGQLLVSHTCKLLKEPQVNCMDELKRAAHVNHRLAAYVSCSNDPHMWAAQVICSSLPHMRASLELLRLSWADEVRVVISGCCGMGVAWWLTSGCAHGWQGWHVDVRCWPTLMCSLLWSPSSWRGKVSWVRYISTFSFCSSFFSPHPLCILLSSQFCFQSSVANCSLWFSWRRSCCCCTVLC